MHLEKIRSKVNPKWFYIKHEYEAMLREREVYEENKKQQGDLSTYENVSTHD